MSFAEPAPIVVPDEEEPLAALGMPAPIRRLYREALGQRAGLVAIAGPPSAGKRTTIHAGLAFRLGSAEAAIVTEIDGRAAAERAVAAALEGRLVLFAIESPDAIGAIKGLQNMVESFLLAASLRAVIAQRLVRRLCPACREPVQAIGSQGSLLGLDPGAVIWQPRGCDQCAGNGYRGRTAVFEAVRIDEVLGRLIAGGDAAVIASHAFRQSPNLISAARTLVQEGVTSADEAILLSRTAA